MTQAPKSWPIDELAGAALEAAAQQYESDGFLFVEGIEAGLTGPFVDVVAAAAGAGSSEFRHQLAAEGEEWHFSRDVRSRLAKVATTAALADAVLATLGPLVTRLLGPLVHVSSTFHSQFKGRSAEAHAVDHGGYPEGFDYMELHGAYLLHQDFAGANLATSPSALTLWVGLNECPDWTLRLYPGSHRQGLICDRWLSLDDERLLALGPAVDVAAQPGRAVVFHADMVHGTGRPGAGRRASCDLRLFPLCGFLPTVPRRLTARPLADLARMRASTNSPTLLAPLLEAAATLGQPLPSDDPPPQSALHWAHVIAAVAEGDGARAKRHLAAMVNTELATGNIEAFAQRLLGHPLQHESLATLRERLAEAEPESPDLAAFDRQLARLAERCGPAAASARTGKAGGHVH